MVTTQAGTEIVPISSIQCRAPITLWDRQGQHELVELKIKPPIEAIYAIGDKADFYSDFYDVLADEIGIAFGKLNVVSEDENTVEVELSCNHYNRRGQPIPDSVSVKIDVRLQFEESRLKWMPPEKWKTGTNKNGETYKYKEPDHEKIKELKDKGFLLDEIIYD